jgi:hypothetical protein
MPNNVSARSKWLRLTSIFLCLAVISCLAVYVSSKTSTVPAAVCPRQQFDIGYGSRSEFLDASPSIIFASLESFGEKNIKGNAVPYPRFRVVDEIKGDYFRNEEIVEVCPVISRDAYRPGQKALIFFEGKDKDLNLWSPTLGATGISSENDSGKFTVFDGQTMSLDEIRQKIR